MPAVGRLNDGSDPTEGRLATDGSVAGRDRPRSSVTPRLMPSVAPNVTPADSEPRVTPTPAPSVSPAPSGLVLSDAPRPSRAPAPRDGSVASVGRVPTDGRVAAEGG